VLTVERVSLFVLSDLVEDGDDEHDRVYVS
jgi:hypothetical protein